MARPPIPTPPAKDAAALLRRLGFAILFLALPVAGLLFRRGVVVLLPIGVALIVVAAALDGGLRPLRLSLDRLAASTGVTAAILAMGWAALSIGWTPGGAVSGERLVGYLTAPALGLAAYLALPDRTRSANLYLAPIGTALGAAVAIALLITGQGAVGAGEEDGSIVERGIAALALFLWPSIAWLRSRSRDAEAAILTIVVAVAVGLASQKATGIALAAGAAAYVAAALGGRSGALAVGGIMAASLLGAPLVAALPRIGGFVGLDSWGAVIGADPARLVTGHGLGGLLRARFAGLVPAAMPDSSLIQVWYDLGLVGALGIAAALWACLVGADRSYGPLLPGITGGIASGFVLASAGIGTGQAWAHACMVVFALVFVAAERGQFRTRRPRAGALAPG